MRIFLSICQYLWQIVLSFHRPLFLPYFVELCDTVSRKTLHFCGYFFREGHIHSYASLYYGYYYKIFNSWQNAILSINAKLAENNYLIILL